MRADVETITPTIAEAYLAANYARNRNIKKGVVKSYASDMSSGRWMLTGQGIQFDTDGVLIDGQHRLNAVILSGASVPMMVLRGVPKESFDHVDVGISRSVQDVLQSRGQHPGNAAIATARFIEFDAASHQIVERRSAFEMFDLYRKHQPYIDAVCAGGHVQSVTSSPVLGACALAMYYEPFEVVQEFVARLRDGFSGSSRDRTVIVLREHLRKVGTISSSTARAQACWKTQRAIKAFRAGEILSKMQEQGGPAYTPRSAVR